MPNPNMLSPHPSGLPPGESQLTTTPRISDAAPVLSLEGVTSEASNQPATDASAILDGVSGLVNGTHREVSKTEETLQTVPEATAIEVRHFAR
jgi:hypothetical protein